MRAVCQRVSEARVRVAGEVVGEIGTGLCVLLGIARGDADVEPLAGKIARLRITGGAGYLGSEVCRLAVERGLDVLATQLATPPPHGRAVRLDVRDADAVQRVLMRHGPEVVVHTAYRMSDDETIVRGSHAVA